jgi:hypothetical protein
VSCGARPARRVVLFAITGMLLGIRFVRYGGRHCRDCGIARFRETTAHTLTAGWWSLTGLFIAPILAVVNAVQRPFLGRLPAPVPGPDGPPARPGTPVLRRVGPWVGTLLVPVLLVVAYVVIRMASGTW